MEPMEGLRHRGMNECAARSLSSIYQKRSVQVDELPDLPQNNRIFIALRSRLTAPLQIEGRHVREPSVSCETSIASSTSQLAERDFSDDTRILARNVKV